MSPRNRPDFRRSLAALLDRAAPFLFVVALVLAAFAGGMYVNQEKVFPHEYIRAAWKTGLSLFQMHFSKHSKAIFVDVPSGGMEAHRFEFIGADALAGPILVPGRAWAFSEYCPGAKG